MCPSAVRYKIYIFQGLQNRSRTRKREIRLSSLKGQLGTNYLSLPPRHYHQTRICSNTLTSNRTSSICASSDRSHGLRSSKSKGGSSGRRGSGSVGFQTPGPPILSGIVCASFYRSNIPIASLVNGHVASGGSISGGFNHVRHTRTREIVPTCSQERGCKTRDTCPPAAEDEREKCEMSDRAPVCAIVCLGISICCMRRL